MTIGAGDEAFLPGEPPLMVVVDRAEARVAVRGELDVATAPHVRAALDDLLAGVVAGAVVIDLSRVEFMATAGVEVLVEARDAAERGGHELIVRVVADGAVARTLRHAGFETRHGVTVLDVDAAERVEP